MTGTADRGVTLAPDHQARRPQLTIELSEDASKGLIEHDHDEQMGARPMARVIKQHGRTSCFVRVRI